jgi:membrane protease YdiL (CAAX protease family)
VPPLSLTALSAFAALTVALLLLWAPRASAAPHAASWWRGPFAVAVVLAVAAGVLDARGVLALLVLGTACLAARRASAPATRMAAHGVMLAASAVLLLHVVPGFDNPRVLSDVIISPGAEPYTKYLNFDKGVVGLFLLGLYAPDRPAADEGAGHLSGLCWRLGILAVLVMGLSLGFGYVRWDPKLPSWWPLWAWSMVFLTALPEEAVFRGVVQEWIARVFRQRQETARADVLAAVVAGSAFGLAHLSGGLVYVVLAAAAGIGYGWIYARTRSIGAAIAAHAGLNTVHFALFTYPALASAGAAAGY